MCTARARSWNRDDTRATISADGRSAVQSQAGPERGTRSGSRVRRVEVEGAGRGGELPRAAQTARRRSRSGGGRRRRDGRRPGVPDRVGSSDVVFGWRLNDTRPRRGPEPRTGSSSPASTARVVRAAAKVWDSGRVASAEQAFVAYRGPAVGPRHRLPVDRADVGGVGRPEPFAGARRRSRPACGDARLEGRDGSVGPPDHDLEPDEYTYARKEFTLSGVTDRAGPRVRVGRPAVRAVRERHPRREGPGVLLSRLAVLRDPRRHRRCCGPARANAVGHRVRAGRGRPRATPPASPA